MSRIGRYEIRETLGTGAMGRVYRAYDTVLEREVALKTIRTGLEIAPEIRQRFQREARACARLRHPHIITVYDLGEAEDLAYIAMELLQGADFRKLIQERRDVPLESKIEAAAQICEALGYAHREGLVHRDIKPSNLFLTDDGGAKVLDFGIARLPASDLTMRGQVLGTPKYIAPEQIQGKPTDGRADLFSVAVVLFEWLTGAHPFQSEMAPQRIVQGEPDSLLAKDPTLPAALERVIARGLEKDPQKRYLTGEEFAKDLRSVLDSLPNRAARAASAAAPAPEPAGGSSASASGCSRSSGMPAGGGSRRVAAFRSVAAATGVRNRVGAAGYPGGQRSAGRLEARLSGDIRFAEALRLCRSRMPFQVASAVETSKPAMAVAPPPAQPKAMPPEDVDVDATIFGRTSIRPEMARPAAATPPVVEAAPAMTAPPARPAAPREAPRPAPPVSRRPPEPPAPAVQPIPPAQPAPQATEPRSQGGSRKALLIVAVLVFGAALAGAAFLYLQPAQVEPAVATATIGPGGSNVYSNPSTGESVVVSLAAGAQVNVLSLPAQRGQEWIRVQAVTPSVSRAGYIHTSALRDWHAKTAAGEMAVARLMEPALRGRRRRWKRRPIGFPRSANAMATIRRGGRRCWRLRNCGWRRRGERRMPAGPRRSGRRI